MSAKRSVFKCSVFLPATTQESEPLIKDFRCMAFFSTEGCKNIKNRKPNLASVCPSARGRDFTQPIAYIFTHLSIYAVLEERRGVRAITRLSRTLVKLDTLSTVLSGTRDGQKLTQD